MKKAAHVYCIVQEGSCGECKAGLQDFETMSCLRHWCTLYTDQDISLEGFTSLLEQLYLPAPTLPIFTYHLERTTLKLFTVKTGFFITFRLSADICNPLSIRCKKIMYYNITDRTNGTALTIRVFRFGTVKRIENFSLYDTDIL